MLPMVRDECMTQKENGVEGTVVEAYAEDLPGNVTKGEVEL